jgi:hypothetical protein
MPLLRSSPPFWGTDNYKDVAPPELPRLLRMARLKTLSSYRAVPDWQGM